MNKSKIIRRRPDIGRTSDIRRLSKQCVQVCPPPPTLSKQNDGYNWATVIRVNINAGQCTREIERPSKNLFIIF